MAETYRRWRLPELWQMIAADHPANTHLHLMTLRRQQTALETQRDRLRSLRDQLAEAWPPDKSEAASAFIQRLNDMIRAMSDTANGAAEVRSRVSLIADALDHARAELAPLVEQYQKTADVPDQRVGEHARRLLDEHARKALMAADAAILEPAASLDINLPTYQRISLPTPVAATPVATSTATTSGSGSGGASGGIDRSPAMGYPPPPRFDPPEATVDIAQDDGLLLAATTAVDDAGRSLTSLLPGKAGQDPWFGPGRVLGAPAALSAPGPGRGPAQMGQVAGAPVGGRVAGMTTAPGAVRPAGRTAAFEEQANRRRATRGDQDEPWSVPHGVPPVIEPPADRPHDPGPGVLGIDR